MNITDIVTRAAVGNSKVAAQKDHFLRIQLSNHSALAALANNTASVRDVDQLIAARNMAEAIRSTAHLGNMHKDILIASHAALIEIGKRLMDTGTPTATAEEVSALTDLLELHDAQLEQVTVIQMERAINLIKNRMKSGRVSIIRASKAQPQ